MRAAGNCSHRSRQGARRSRIAGCLHRGASAILRGMKPIIRVSLVVVMLARAGTAAGQSVPPERAADAALIRAQIEDICRAFVDKDRKTLTETHGKDWRGFTPGSESRDSWSRRLHERSDLQSAHAQGGRHGRLPHVGLRRRLLRRHGGGLVPARRRCRVQRDEAHQRLTLLDVFHKGPKGSIQVASNTSLHPDELARRMSEFRTLGDAERKDVLRAREAVWRAWFAGDTAALTALVPPELVTIDPGADTFGTRASNLEGSRAFAAGGGKLTRLVFPRTEFQAYGNTVILYTTYELDTVSDGKMKTERGAATEVFVRQGDRWLNTGWQLAPLNGPK